MSAWSSACQRNAGPPRKFAPRMPTESAPSQLSIDAWRRRSGSRSRSARRRRCSRASGCPVRCAGRRRAVEPAAHAAAHRHHHAGRAVVGALAAVLGDAAAELRELEHERVARAAPGSAGRCRTPVSAVVQRRHQVRVRPVGRVRVLPRVRVEAAGLHPEHLRADALAPSRRRRSAAPAPRPLFGYVTVGAYVATVRHAIERRERRLRGGVDEREVRPIDRQVRRDARRASAARPGRSAPPFGLANA